MTAHRPTIPATRAALAATALLVATPAPAMVPPWPQPVANAQVTRELVWDHPDIHRYRICVEGPRPAGGFDARYVEVALRRPAPQYLDVLLRPTVGPDGRACAEVAAARAAEPELDIEIRDAQPGHEPVLYYLGPLLAIPDGAAGR